MSYSLRAELAALLKRATEQRRRIKVLQASLDQLTDRIGRIRSQRSGGPDSKSGARKTSQKK
jgi:hypothetical protein